MNPDHARDPRRVGIIGLVVLVVALLLAANLEKLPLPGTSTYQANFSEAAGLTTDSEVRVAGVEVGEVRDVALEGDHVAVSFRVHDAWIGDQTTAAIKIKTVLGSKYLALDPQGGTRQRTDEPIPVQRTTTPFDVVNAFDGLSRSAGRIDARQLAESFRTASDAFSRTPESVRGTLNGLTALSRTVAERDAQLRQLLEHAGAVSRTIAARDADLDAMLRDGNVLLREVRARRDSVHGLLLGTRNLSTQLNGLVEDDREQLAPTLDRLDRVAGMLQRNQDELDRSLHAFNPFIRMLTNNLGNGHWVDIYLCGLLPPALGPVNQRGCH